MQQKSISRIGIILFLFVFGFVCFRFGLVDFAFSDIDPAGAVHLLLTAIGALCLVLGVYLVKKRWF